MASPRTKAANKYNREHTKSYLLRVNLKTEPELVHHLDNIPNKSGYLKSLIKVDMHNKGDPE